VIDYMSERLESILEQVRIYVAEGEGRLTADILSRVASIQGATITSLPQYVLYNTTVQAALSALYARGEIYPLFQENYLVWYRRDSA
jgi:uncharacterized membrane protein